MADQPGHLSRHRPESVPTPVPIAEAAARLGITIDAVRKRIQRGKLAGHKTDNGWVVVWTETDTRPDSVPTPVQGDTAVIDVLRDSLARQQEEIEFLRRQVEETERRHAVEIERRDILLRQAMGLLPALPATTSRPDAPTDSPQAPGSTETAQRGTETSQVDGRSWWRRLWG